MIEFRINTTATHVEILSDQLLLLGACAVSLVDAANQPIYEPAPGEIILWQETTVVAHFEDNNLNESIASFLTEQQHTSNISGFTQTVVPETDWVRSSLDQFEPQQFGQRLWICPSWIEPPQLDAVNVMLDPGLAFGTGTHPTTKLCLEWLDRHIQGNEQIIDYGCGSGILAVAALKLGAAEAIAVDHDPQALDACMMNAEQNRISLEAIQVYFPDELPLTTGDILLANILAKPLIELAPTFATLVKTGGSIVLSGILDSQKDAVIAAYQPYFTLNPPTIDGDWVRIDGTKN
jgi:ribosomal protein L11 methyltransferase